MIEDFVASGDEKGSFLRKIINYLFDYFYNKKIK